MIRKAAILALIVTIVFAVASCEKNSAGPKDKTPPTVEMLTPWDGTVRDGIVEVTVEADDDAGIARVELYVNNKLYGTDTTKPYSFQWDMGELADGSENTLFVKAVDGHGNKAVTEIITVTKGKTAAPVAKITSPSDGTTIKQGETLVLSGTATDEDEGDLSDSQITWSSHLQGVLGQGLTLSYRGLVIGEHVITMTATDSNGITDKKTVKVTVVDNDLPYATVEKGTYYIGEPVFKRRMVRLTKGFYVYKTEMTVQEFLELWAIVEGSASKPDYAKARKWADKRNKKLFDVRKNTGLYLPLFEYGGKSKDPITTTYSNYPACFITYVEACVVCNAMSDRDGLERVYIYLDKNDEDVADQQGRERLAPPDRSRVRGGGAGRVRRCEIPVGRFRTRRTLQFDVRPEPSESAGPVQREGNLPRRFVRTQQVRTLQHCRECGGGVFRHVRRHPSFRSRSARNPRREESEVSRERRGMV